MLKYKVLKYFKYTAVNYYEFNPNLKNVRPL